MCPVSASHGLWEEIEEGPGFFRNEEMELISLDQ